MLDLTTAQAMDAIDRRVSRRSFTGGAPDESAGILSRLAVWCSEQSGLLLRFVPDGGALFNGFGKSYGMFSGVRSFFVVAGPQDDPALREKAGYWGELLVLKATQLGLGSCWVGGTFDRSALERALPGGTKLVAVIPVGTVKPQKTAKENLIYRFTHRDELAQGKFYTSDALPPAWFMAGVKAVMFAPSALNRKPVRLVWQDGKATIEIPGQNESEWIDLGIAKLHFEIAAGGRFPTGNDAVFAPGANILADQ